MTSLIDHLDAEILGATQQVRQARDTKRDIVEAVQRRCVHRIIAEAPAEPSFSKLLTGVLPAFRVCLVCGLHEYERDNGFRFEVLMTRKPAEISREQGYAIRDAVTP